MPKKKSKPSNAGSKKPALKPEVIKKPKKFSFKKSEKKRRENSNGKISSSYRLLKDSLSFFFQYWKVFVGITLVYALLSVLLVGLNAGANISELEEGVGEAFGENISQVGLGVLVFMSMIGASGNPGEGSAPFQSILTIMISLATIWALRQLMSGQKAGVKDAFYKGMYPLVPVLLVILVMGMQLLPVVVAGFLYGTLIVSGLAVSPIEVLAWGVFIFLLVLSSLYMLSSSIFAFYIVTLPDMRPLQALRSARQLVRYRRWSVMRRILFLPFSMFIIGLVVVLPLIWIWPPLAQWVFLVLSMGSLVFSHVYLYSLYKELL